MSAASEFGRMLDTALRHAPSWPRRVKVAVPCLHSKTLIQSTGWCLVPDSAARYRGLSGLRSVWSGGARGGYR